MTQGIKYRLDPDDDPESVERGLAALVLTLVELIRELMERQALRRVEEGTVTDEQAERLGYTLMRLNERMDELVEEFGLERRDLNIDLGPLGPLLPKDLVSSCFGVVTARFPLAACPHWLPPGGLPPAVRARPCRRTRLPRIARAAARRVHGPARKPDRRGHQRQPPVPRRPARRSYDAGPM